MNEAFMRITQVAFQTDNLLAAVIFYNGKMGFPLLRQSDAEVSFEIGSSVLIFQQARSAPPPYHLAFLVPKNQFAEAYRWAKQEMFVLPFTETSDIAHFDNWNAQAFYFHDAAKNILEIITHHDLPEGIEQPFSSQAITCICETGLVVPDVAAACRKLEKQYGIERFAKGPFAPHFAVMGVEDALLILSAEGRGWLPTGVPALPAAGSVTLVINEKNIVIDLPFS